MFKLFVITLVLVLLSLSMKKNTLSMLLSLEFLILLILILLLKSGNEIFLTLIMICVGACEGAVGLGAMIGATRVKRKQNLEWI